MKYVKFKKIIVASLLLLTFFQLKAQPYKALNIGDQVPSFSFTLINDVIKKSNLQDFKGKLLMLDFWALGCSSCIDGFPKMEALQKEFGDKVKIILVNAWANMDKLNEQAKDNKLFKKNVGFSTLPASNGDSTWKQLFPHSAVPLHVWVDPSGKVVAKTYPHNVNSANIQKVLDGKALDLVPVKFFDWDSQVKSHKGLVQASDSMLLPMRFAAFAPYTPGAGGLRKIMNSGNVNPVPELLFSNTSIVELYNYALQIGSRTHLPVVIESTNKKVSHRPRNPDLIETWSRNNLYCLQLFDENATREEMGEWMFDELNVFFGRKFNIQAVVQRKRIKFLHLVSSWDSNQQVSDKPGKSSISDTLISIQNKPVKYLFDVLKKHLEDLSVPQLFTIEGDTEKKVDIILKGDPKDLENLNRLLKPYNVRIDETYREIEVIVIKDK
ncbi:MAG: TlpA family protein disulfide reductase [Pseudobacter sp.]|uniref:TlpA family protein disulfide reductase n=1 Tax=Pseudobacter sp. TaxID=2045420 RepID=UPI003F7F9106